MDELDPSDPVVPASDLPGPEPDLLDPSVYDSPSRDCDLIMKGGITSGVVYPRAACRLATRYRFRLLGGASAGAIAAVGVAAAEYGRASGGFVRLAALPTDLGAKLGQLFQPSPSTRSAFAVLSALLEPGWTARRKVRALVGAVLRAAWRPYLVALLLLLLPAVVIAMASRGWPEGSAYWAGVARGVGIYSPLALMLALVPAAVSLARRTLRDLPANGFGLCDGHTSDPAVDSPALTDWMVDTFDTLAGLQDGPLTFGHLWGGEAVAAAVDLARREADGQRVLPHERRAARSSRQVDLEVITTSLTFRRPYRFPFEAQLFFFCADRLRTYFPGRVVDHMVATSVEAEDEAGGEGQNVSMLCPCHRERVRRLPAAHDLPVVLAARLSLSFPGLISAVPLFAVDWSRGPGRRQLVAAWFSDGGIASNFPMHLFDALWPSRPTFGFDLEPQHPDFPDQMVWRPSAGAGAVVPRSQPITSMVGFLSAILRTMQNWVDATQITLPGYRDRVAAVRQRGDEGGMNLKMPAETIEALADRGAEAAALFDDFDLGLHQWIRYRVAMSEFDGILGDLAGRWDGGYQDFVARYGPATPHYGLGSPQATTADHRATTGLMGVAAAWGEAGHPSSMGAVPQPRPALRIVPRQ